MSIAYTVHRIKRRIIAVALGSISDADFFEYLASRRASDVVAFDQLLDLRRAAALPDRDAISAWLAAEHEALADRPAGRVAMVSAPETPSDEVARAIQQELSAVLVESAVFANHVEAEAWLTSRRERVRPAGSTED